MANEQNQDSVESSERAEQYAEQQAQADAAEVEGEGAEQEASSEEALNAKIETLASALDAAKEQVLRSQAEAQNARRRAEQDVEKAHKFGQEKLVVDLLPVVDNLERALENLDRDDAGQKAVIEGIELTYKSFVDALVKHKVEPVNPKGEPFDPELHQAMSMLDNPDVEPNTVLEVFQKGYTLHGRLVRPAMVVVSKPE